MVSRPGQQEIMSREWNNTTITGPNDEAIDETIRHLEQQQAALAKRDAQWGTDTRTAMSRLCELFPLLRGVPGTNPWDPESLIRWLLTSGAPTTAGTHAAKFVLQVWRANADWQAYARWALDEGGLGIKDAELTPFNAVNALQYWDDAHTAAFKTRLNAPFWP